MPPTLEWLDLSFNAISKIEGLDKLTRLSDLSLYHNNITKIEGLDKCKEMNVLSLGRNKIKSLESIKYLRQFRKLQVVSFAGNLMCSDSDYKFFSLAYLKYIRYLDYQLVDSNELVAAREQFQDFLQELEEKECLEEKSFEMQANQADHFAKIKAANLESVDSLLQLMYKEDTEHEKLKYLPFMSELMDDYQTKFTVCVGVVVPRKSYIHTHTHTHHRFRASSSNL